MRYGQTPGLGVECLAFSSLAFVYFDSTDTHGNKTDNQQMRARIDHGRSLRRGSPRPRGAAPKRRLDTCTIYLALKQQEIILLSLKNHCFNTAMS